MSFKILSVSVFELTQNGGIQDTNIGLWTGPENTKKEEIYLSSFYDGGVQLADIEQPIQPI